MPMDQALKTAREALAKAGSIAVLTGAGVSADSGVPTFRGPGGLWEDHRPEELATPQAFAADPELVWRWYAWRRSLIADCQPNPAHLALARLEAGISGYTLITQNVDGLHHLAGSRNVLELHGSIWRLRCVACGAEETNRGLDLPPLPRCGQCGGLLRPGVVWFGESLDEAILQKALQAAQGCQVMLVIGTSAVVQPAASLSSVAKGAGAFVIEVNLDPTPNSGLVDVSLMGKAAEIMPALVERP